MTSADPLALYETLQCRLAKHISPQPFSAVHNLRLERITALLNQLGRPHLQVPVVHVGGTSGKGSTASFVEAIVRHHGRRTGLHLSPHLQIINERHQLNGRPAPTQHLLDCLPALEAAAQQSTAPPFGAPSYFEVQLALSLMLFVQQSVDVAVVEVGVGGTRDATNVLPASVAILTNVGLDHTDLLGDTHLKIATDKAGIIKPNQQVFSAVTQPEVVDHVRRRCQAQGATLHLLGEHVRVEHHGSGVMDVHLPGQQLRGLRIGMAGSFQAQNAALALGAARSILGHDLDAARTQKALSSVQLPGRAECIQQHPAVILDGAHNPDKIRAAAAALPPQGGTRVAVVALKAGKDAQDILQYITTQVDHIILTQFRSKGLWQSTAPSDMKPHAPHALIVDDPDEAVETALQMVGEDGLVWVTGSLYLIGDVRSRWVPVADLLRSL